MNTTPLTRDNVRDYLSNAMVTRTTYPEFDPIMGIQVSMAMQQADRVLFVDATSQERRDVAVRHQGEPVPAENAVDQVLVIQDDAGNQLVTFVSPFAEEEGDSPEDQGGFAVLSFQREGDELAALAHGGVNIGEDTVWINGTVYSDEGQMAYKGVLGQALSCAFYEPDKYLVPA